MRKRLGKLLLGETVPTLTYRYEFKAYNEDGKIIFHQVKYNLVTTTGKGLLLDRLFGLNSTPAALTYMGLSIGQGTPAVTDTQLSSGAYLQAFDALPTRSGLVVSYQTTFGPSVANFNCSEIGTFNGNTNGTSVLFGRLLFGPFTKTNTTTLIVQLTVTQS